MATGSLWMDKNLSKMKKYITLILLALMVTIGSMAQRRDAIRYEKVEGDTTQINKWLFWYGTNPPGLTKVYKDSVMYVQYAGDSCRFHPIGDPTWSEWVGGSTDSINSFTPKVFEKSISSDGENNIPITFQLKPTSLIFYNGKKISLECWSGIGKDTITLELDTRIYDLIMISK